MSGFDSPLDNLKVASPCSANWSAMQGDERKRHCGECKLNVYNLSGMTKYDAENLLRLAEGRLCVRYVQRADGTILTQDCPVGWAKVKQSISVFAAAAFAMIFSVLGSVFVLSLFSGEKEVVGRMPIPFATPTPRAVPLMGAIAMPSPTPGPRVKMGELKAVPTPTPKASPERRTGV